MSIPRALADVRNRLKRAKPGTMKADLVSTVRELLTQIDRELKLHEEAAVDHLDQQGDHDDGTLAVSQPQPASAQPASTIKNGFMKKVAALWDEDLEAPARGLNTETVRILKETYLSVIHEAHKAARAELSRLRRRANEREAIRKRVSAEQFHAACDALNITARFGGDVDLDAVRRKAAKTAALFPPRQGPRSNGCPCATVPTGDPKAREALERYQKEKDAYANRKEESPS